MMMTILFAIGGVQTIIPTVTHLTQYFEKHPIYELTYLCHPYVTKNSYRQSQMFDTDGSRM